MTPILETKRLVLRAFRLTDEEAVYEFCSNDEVSRYTGQESIKTLKEAREIITDVWFQDYQTYGYGRLAIVYKPEDRVIGFAGLKYLPELGETDIGYRFLPSYWGKGIGTEASREILKYGFESLSLARIIGIADPDNHASCKILQKLGMKLYQQASYTGSERIYNWYEIEQVDYLQQKAT